MIPSKTNKQTKPNTFISIRVESPLHIIYYKQHTHTHIYNIDLSNWRRSDFKEKSVPFSCSKRDRILITHQQQLTFFYLTFFYNMWNGSQENSPHTPLISRIFIRERGNTSNIGLFAVRSRSLQINVLVLPGVEFDIMLQL